MQAARDALDRAVQQLFARPTRKRAERHVQNRSDAPCTTPLRTSARTRNGSGAATHPLCECLALQPLADDWQYLRRFPVLKRYVLAQWRSHCEQFSRGQTQRQHLQHHALATPAASLSAAFARRRAIVVRSLEMLCVQLYQCGVLHAREVEFVELLVAETLASGLGDVLLLHARRDGSSRDSASVNHALPLRVRMLLLHTVLTHVASRLSVTPGDALDSSSDIAASWQLVLDICTSLHDDVLDAMATLRVDANGTTTTRLQLLETAASANAVCSFCRTDTALQSMQGSPWRELQTLTVTLRTLLQRVDAANDCSSSTDIHKRSPRDNDRVVRALAELRVLLSRRDITQRLASRDVRHRPQQRVADTLATAAAASNAFVSFYECEQISRRVVAAMRVQLRLATTGKNDSGAARLVLWERMWRRAMRLPTDATDDSDDSSSNNSSSSSMARQQHLPLVELVTHCVTTDCFALATTTSLLGGSVSDTNTMDVPSLPGYQIVCALLDTNGLDRVDAIPLLAHITTQHHSVNRRGATHVAAAAHAFAIGAISRQYVTQLLLFHDNDDRLTAARGRFLPEADSARLVALLQALYTIFTDASRPSLSSPRSDCLIHKQWERLLQRWVARTDDSDAIATTTSHALALLSFQALGRCYCIVQQSLDPNSSDAAFPQALAAFVFDTIEQIVATNAQSIGASHNNSDAMRATVCAIACASTPHWLCALVVRLLQRERTSDRRAWHWTQRRLLARGIERLFFPALAAVVHDADDVFTDLLQRVLAHMQTLHNRHSAATSLLHFCAHWDAWHLQHDTTTTGSAPSGRDALVRLDVARDLLRVFERPQSLALERPDALQCLQDVLERVTNSPPVLEASLFQLLTRIKRQLANPLRPLPTTTGDEAIGPQLVGLTRDDPVTPLDDDALLSLLRPLVTGSIHDVRAAIETLKRNPELLQTLRRHVERWLDLLATPNSVSSYTFGHETKRQFAVVCSRLLCWLPPELVATIRDAVTPVPQSLVDLLSDFAEASARDDDDSSSEEEAVATRQGQWRRQQQQQRPTTRTTGVRMEFAIRSFVQSSVAPDLCELTDVVVHAIISCTTTSTRDALLALIQRMASVLLVEVALETLRLSLQTECLVYLAPSPLHSSQDTAGAVNRLSNTLSIVALSSELFRGRAITWSASLVDTQALRHWLLCFFDCLVHAEQSRAPFAVDELLSSLEVLTQQSLGGTGGSAIAVEHSYLLTALLCTASFPQTRLVRSTWSEFDTSLDDMTHLLLAALTPPVQAMDAPDDNADALDDLEDDDDSDVLVVHLDPFAVAYARVSEDALTIVPARPLASSTQLTRAATTALFVQRLRREREHVTPGDATPRLYARFALWLSSATIYSQSIASSTSTMSIDAWEQVFSDYVVYLYLPTEFRSCTAALLRAWLCHWLCMNIDTALDASTTSTTQPLQLLVLLPFQQQLFARLSAARQRETPQHWTLLLTAIQTLLARVRRAPDAADAAIVVLDDTVAAFDLVSICTQQLALAQQQPTVALTTASDDVLERFVALCGDVRLVSFSALQLLHVLKYPLELVASCFINSSEWDMEDSRATERRRSRGPIDVAPVSRERWLECALVALAARIEAAATADKEKDDEEDDVSDSDEEEGHSGTTARTRRAARRDAELLAFQHAWTRTIELKYAFIEPTRCAQFVAALAAALDRRRHVDCRV